MRSHFRKTHYEMLAAVIREARAFVPAESAAGMTMWTAQLDIAQRLAEMFAADNPAFDRTRFLSACFPHS